MAKQDREAWVRAGLARLAEQGVEGVRVEPLAKALGVTKGSFYWHFADRGELLDAMLEAWSSSATAAVIERSEAAGPDSKARLERLTEIASQGFDGKVELAIRNWSQADARVARVVEEIDATRLGYLRRLLKELGASPLEAEARAFLVYSLLWGDYLLPARHGRFRRKRVLRACFDLLGGA